VANRQEYETISYYSLNPIVPVVVDMSELPPRSAALSDPNLRPDQEMIDCAVTATLDHPLAIEACSFNWCHAVVMREPKTFLVGTKFPEKLAIFEALSDCEHVLLGSYNTSVAPPEPLAGFGKTFDFILHPKSFAILAAASGTWRS
jgi:hypothetical protein